MKLSDFDYSFPEELIATEAQERGASNILVATSNSTDLHIVKACDILSFIQPEDCLVVNNTKVIPARLKGSRSSGGKVEILLIEPKPEREGLCWEAWVKPGKAFKQGAEVTLAGMSARVETIQDDGSRILSFDSDYETFSKAIQEEGHVPLPPYINRESTDHDKESYQTIFAKHEGAVAAPTASLHFSHAMMEALKKKGTSVAEVTLHVGPGTFSNIEHDDFTKHSMHGERYEITPENADRINKCKAKGGRIITVGTTSTRVLETVADSDGIVQPGSGITHAYIYPGYQWKVVTGLLTNFHWPKSSLVLLVAAFYGSDKTKAAYAYAIEHSMKLFSYGDGMLILPPIQ
ncbi:MAG: tRNA preQ1(34) S-adenosylmethionine ribosyltransferase-isomerase QueA [Fibrobacterales bacterium]